ncbi:MAG: hypothetical protein HC796_00775 [Synechococcaceae cyanobacterium RL_1_2]|nr:hypothetical protein [Synechococcaceae cyanobacterium RL_1_2]
MGNDNGLVPNDDDLFQEAANTWNLAKLYEDLGQARCQFLKRKTNTGLTSREKVYLRGILMGNSPKDIAQICYISLSGLRANLSKTIYRYGEVLTNCERNTLSRWEDLIEWLAPNYSLKDNFRTSQKDAIGLPRATRFYGRQELINQYQSLILEGKCSVLGIFGMGGIGKTSLANRLQTLVINDFPYFIWRKLDNPEPLDTFINNFEFITDKTSTDPVNKLMAFLRNHKCLLVLDNWDSLFEDHVLNGQYCEDYKNYQRLLRCLVKEEHQSCVIITSREELNDCTINANTDDRVHQIKLPGLNLDESIGLLQNYGLKDPKQWPKLIDIYQGHPWALKLVAEDIKQTFGGEVVRFLDQLTIVLGYSLEQMIQEQLDKLSPLESEIMYCLTVERFATLSEVLQEHQLSYGSSGDFVKAISSLRRRSLIYGIQHGEHEQLEMGNTLLRYLTKIIVAEVTDEIIEAFNTNEVSSFDVLRKFRLLSPQSEIRDSQVINLLQPITLKLANYCHSDRSVKKNLKTLTDKDKLQELTTFELGYTLDNIQGLIHCIKDE